VVFMAKAIYDLREENTVQQRTSKIHIRKKLTGAFSFDFSSSGCVVSDIFGEVVDETGWLMIL